MHELLLFAQVPAALHDHVLRVLASIAAVRPRPLLEHHLVFAPARPGGPVPRTTGGSGAAPTAAAAATTTADRYVLQLVGHLSTPREDAEMAAAGTQTNGEKSNGQGGGMDLDAPNEDAGKEEAIAELGDCPWTLEFRDQPDVPGRRPATARPMSSVPVARGDPVRFVEAMGYAYVLRIYLTTPPFSAPAYTLLSLALNTPSYTHIYIRYEPAIFKADVAEASASRISCAATR